MADPNDAPTVLDHLRQAGLTVKVDLTKGEHDWVQLPDQPPTVDHDKQLGRYTVTGHLGAGGMGEVLQVRDEDVGRQMAAKVILGDATGPALTKFVQEAQITGQLEHPNIVPMHELGLTPDQRVYFTMKRVEGETLAELLAREREEEGAILTSDSGRRKAAADLTIVRRKYLMKMLNIFLKVCDAIAFAHSKGVIHRDLKPANIMVGRFGEVQVMDWGLAKVVGEPDPVQDACKLDVGGGRIAEMAGPLKTLDGSVVGTPAYMPPEQARGEIDKLDSRADIYSLGAILYEVLTLELPFDGDNVWNVLHSVIEGELVSPSEKAPSRDVPWELEAVVVKAMAASEEDRYGGVGRLKADVEAYLEGRLLAAARYSRVQRVGRWVWKRRKGLIAAVLLLAAVIGGGLAVHQREKARVAG